MTKRVGRRNYLLITGALIVAFTVGATIVHGRLTNRWGRSDMALRDAARALSAFPDRFGPWMKLDDHEFPPNVPGILDFAAAVNRTYTNSESGQIVAVAMIVGPPGPTSTHVAELCYSSKGWVLVGDPVDLTIPATGSGVHHFQQDRYQSPSLDQERQEVCYAWRAGDLWETPQLPRVAFGNAPRLFKIQVAANYQLDSSTEDESACREFLEALLPALDSDVFEKLAE